MRTFERYLSEGMWDTDEEDEDYGLPGGEQPERVIAREIFNELQRWPQNDPRQKIPPIDWELRYDASSATIRGYLRRSTGTKANVVVRVAPGTLHGQSWVKYSIQDGIPEKVFIGAHLYTNMIAAGVRKAATVLGPNAAIIKHTVWRLLRAYA